MSWKTKTLPVVFGLIVLSGSTASRGEESRDPSHFTYARLYCAPDGNTHFQDMTVDLRKTDFAPPAPPIHIGSDFAASRAFFGGFDAGWGARDLENRLNHPTPATQFGIVLQGIFSITTTDGETRRLPPGSVFRLEDTSPCKGHITVGRGNGKDPLQDDPELRCGRRMVEAVFQVPSSPAGVKSSEERARSRKVATDVDWRRRRREVRLAEIDRHVLKVRISVGCAIEPCIGEMRRIAALLASRCGRPRQDDDADNKRQRFSLPAHP